MKYAKIYFKDGKEVYGPTQEKMGGYIVQNEKGHWIFYSRFHILLVDWGTYGQT